MIDDDRTEGGAAAYRGFLFADMRGFTAFADRHGNAAAAGMVSRFLEIARAAIARYQGAEIKTEGDAIHAVFPSASGAVMCGLEIVDSAAELNAQEPGRPLGLGVGVHAGEAVETAEGYIGRAVNIAARLCSAAKAGEVLVSSTVKGITQSSIPVGFIPKGSRRLKGIQDPIVVYAVTRDTSARAPRTVPRPVIGGAAAVAAVAVLGLAVFAGSQLFARPVASPTPTVPPAGQPLGIGELDIGRYTTGSFQPPITFDIVERGWTANRDEAEIFGLLRDEAPRGSVYFLRVQEVIENPCTDGGEGTGTAPGAADLLTQVEALPHLAVSDAETVRVGGFVGRRVSIDVLDSVLAACGGFAGAEVSLFDAGEIWKVSPGERFTMIAVDVSGRAVTILLSTDWTQTPSVQELQSLLDLAQDILDSASF